MAPAGQVVKAFTLARVNITVGAHSVVQRLRQGQPLILARDPKDQYDPEHAVMVIAAPSPGRKYKIGYLPPGLAKEVAPLLDAGVNVIARKGHDPRYGVCQLAYIPPADAPAPVETAPIVVAKPVPKPIELEEAPVELEVPKTTPVAFLFPEGVTQQDLDEVTELPPLGDSRRPRQSYEDRDE